VLSYIAAWVVDAAVLRAEAEGGIYVVAVVVPYWGVRRSEALPVVGRAEGAVRKDASPHLVGDHPMGPEKL
jgi:hypothetical protein